MYYCYYRIFLTNYAACLVLSFVGEYRSELFGLNIFDEGIFGSDKSALNDDIFALSICSLILITAYAFFLPPNIYSLLILDSFAFSFRITWYSISFLQQRNLPWLLRYCSASMKQNLPSLPLSPSLYTSFLRCQLPSGACITG